MVHPIKYFIAIKKQVDNAVLWWCVPLMPSLGRRKQRQRQEEFCEFEVGGLVYISPRAARAT